MDLHVYVSACRRVFVSACLSGCEWVCATTVVLELFFLHCCLIVLYRLISFLKIDLARKSETPPEKKKKVRERNFGSILGRFDLTALIVACLTTFINFNGFVAFQKTIRSSLKRDSPAFFLLLQQQRCHIIILFQFSARGKKNRRNDLQLQMTKHLFLKTESRRHQPFFFFFFIFFPFSRSYEKTARWVDL